MTDNFEIEMRKSLVFGHPDLIKQIPMYSRTEIRNYSVKETHHVIVRSHKKIRSHQRTNSKFDESYELIELAPQIFKNIWTLNKVDDQMLFKIFNLNHMDLLDIKISIGKGGAFFIEPTDGGRLMIKSITKPEFDIIKSFLPDYYSYILMNPNSCLSPILGVFKLKTAESDAVPPICFILMRNVLDLDPTQLNPEDKVLLFDLKGSL